MSAKCDSNAKNGAPPSRERRGAADRTSRRAAGAHPPEQRALVLTGPPPPSEQVAILACGDQLGGAALEVGDRAREQAPCERPLGTGQLAQRLPLGRSGEAEERAPGNGEPLDLRRRDRGCRSAPQSTGQRERVEQRVPLAHVPVEVR